MPTAREISLRASWLGTLSRAERDRLADLSLRDVERLFTAWLGAGGPDG